MGLSYPASRAMSAATAVYGVYALVRPEHLARVMGARADQGSGYDRLAKVYGVRDLLVSSVGVFGPARAVPWAMRSRIAGDLADWATLATKADDGRVRGKVSAVTVGWALLNHAALRWDQRHTAG